MKIAAAVGLLMLVLFLFAGIAIRRLSPPDPRHRLTLGKIIFIAAVAAAFFLVYRWIQSLPWLPREP